MTTFSRSRSSRLRWLPAVIAPVVVAGVVVAAAPLSASAVDLPQKSAQQVLALIAKSDSIAGLSGEVEETSDLGLPSLPTTGAGSSSETTQVLDLLTGAHEFRIYAAGKDDRRVQVLDSEGERDLVQRGTSLWTYDSATNTATHVTVDAAALKKAAAAHAAARPAPSGVLTPDQAATLLLTKLKSFSTVTTSTADQAVSIAGQKAYVLTVTPDTTATTVGSIGVAIDAKTGLPLRLQVFARGSSTPALQIEYTSLTYGVPAASLFAFTPPSGATVHTSTVPKAGVKPSAPKSRPSRTPLPAADRPTVSGSGWSSIVTVPAADVPASVTTNALYLRASTPVAGGRAITSTLVNVLVTTDGRVLSGAVPLSALQAAAAK